LLIQQSAGEKERFCPPAPASELRSLCVPVRRRQRQAYARTTSGHRTPRSRFKRMRKRRSPTKWRQPACCFLRPVSASPLSLARWGTTPTADGGLRCMFWRITTSRPVRSPQRAWRAGSTASLSRGGALAQRSKTHTVKSLADDHALLELVRHASTSRLIGHR
jgi:hypothetical protein